MIKFQRKSISFFLAALVFVLSVFQSTAIAAEDSLNIKGESAILIDADTGRILYQKNPDTSLPPASMTKMMTEYLVLEAIKEGRLKWDEKTGISEYVYKISQDRSLSNVPLRRDVEYTVKELYESMAIYSANGSTIAITEILAGSETNFVKMMNQKGSELGLKDYKFVNSTGLNNIDLQGMHPEGTAPDEENMMSARDTALLGYRLIKDFPEVLDTSKIPEKYFQEDTSDEIKMQNWNWMIPGTMYGVYDYPGVDGIKTGSTDLGGYSFTATAKKGDIRLISVVMRTNSYAERFGETKKLLDYGFSNFTKKELYPAGYKIEGQSLVPVVKGKEKVAEVALQKPVTMLVKKGEEDLFQPSYQFDSALLKNGALVAPLSQDQVVGSLILNYKGTEDMGYLTEDLKTTSQVPVVTTTEVKKANWFVLFFRAIGEFFSGLLKK